MAVTRLAISAVVDTGMDSSRSLSFPPNTTPLAAKAVNSIPPTSAPIPIKTNTSTSIWRGASTCISMEL